MHRITHLDFKGAPLKTSYLRRVLKYAKRWGCTGVLIEWEDTFPYTGELEDIGSLGGCGGDNMYSKEEVEHIFTCAKELDLEVIQLIQTIGHMEFVLKHPAFRELREAPRTPAVLCPSKPQSLNVVKNMLKQALDMQPNAKYFHIGADEVWHTAVCEQCQSRAMTSEHKAPSLYLEHIREVVLFIKKQRPDLIVLMWDDMLRSINLQTLEHYNLGELVQPVIWNYNVKEHFHIEPDLWDLYKTIFPDVWAGSAFKGANGSCQVLSPVTRYMSNQRAWLAEMKDMETNYNRVNFVGVILTGWSRYDHYSTLCELLPAALPSLCCCLSYWKLAEDNNEADLQISEVLSDKEWPGNELARCVHSFVALRERACNLIHGDLVATWLTPWQISRSYTSPVQVDGIAGTASSLLADLRGLQEDFDKNFSSITGKRSEEEWVASFLTPLLNKMKELHDVAVERCYADASVRPVLKLN